jgi:hypothetical protein
VQVRDGYVRREPGPAMVAISPKRTHAAWAEIAEALAWPVSASSQTAPFGLELPDHPRL